MQYITLGNSDLKVSRICLGCMGFGDAKSGQHSWTIDEAHSREIIRRAVELVLTAEELAYLEEPYVPHALVGVMAQNTASAAKESHVWSAGSQKI